MTQRLSMRRLLAAPMVLLLVAMQPLLAAPAQDRVADPALEARVQAVAADLRCLVCQNQSLADSHAELALDLKNQVREQLRAGRTPEQVMAYMTDRYGDFVLYRPPLKLATGLLWFGPALLLLGLGWALWRRLEAVRPDSDRSSDPEADQERADRLLMPGDATGLAGRLPPAPAQPPRSDPAHP